MPFNYRSTNATGYTHFGGAMVIGTELGSGIEINPTSSGAVANIQAAGDEAAKSIAIMGKGTGGVQLGSASTTPIALMQRYLVQFTVPALSSASSAESTVTVLGLTTNSCLFITPRTKLNSTVTGVCLTARCSTADELVVEYHNVSQSSLSGSTQSAYLFQISF
jgi:hypothetical protein